MKIGRNDPCPCGSGKKSKDCHYKNGIWLNEDEIFRKEPKTSFQNQLCYAKSTNDCSEKISREHYFSKALLNEIGDKLDCSGLPWLDAIKPITEKNLTVKVLCERHNNQLGILDEEATKFFRSLKRIDKIINNLQSDETTLINGNRLELWFLKVFYNMLSSGNVPNMNQAVDKDFAKEDIELLFNNKAFGKECGLWIPKTENNEIILKKEVEFKPLKVDENLCRDGICFTMYGMPLLLRIKPTIFAFEGAYRPSELKFTSTKTKKSITIRITWNDRNSYSSASFTYNS